MTTPTTPPTTTSLFYANMLQELIRTDSIERFSRLTKLLEERITQIHNGICLCFNPKQKGPAYWAWSHMDSVTFEKRKSIVLDRCYDNGSVNVSVGFLDFRNVTSRYLNIVLTCVKPVAGDVKLDKKLIFDLSEGCPVHWLWTDFTEELIQGKARYDLIVELAQKSQRREKELKGYVESLRKEIRKAAVSKLSPEELWSLHLDKMPDSIKAKAEEIQRLRQHA